MKKELICGTLGFGLGFATSVVLFKIALKESAKKYSRHRGGYYSRYLEMKAAERGE